MRSLLVAVVCALALGLVPAAAAVAISWTPLYQDDPGDGYGPPAVFASCGYWNGGTFCGWWVCWPGSPCRPL